MQRLEVSVVVRTIYGSLGVKRLIQILHTSELHNLIQLLFTAQYDDQVYSISIVKPTRCTNV